MSPDKIGTFPPDDPDPARRDCWATGASAPLPFRSVRVAEVGLLISNERPKPFSAPCCSVAESSLQGKEREGNPVETIGLTLFGEVSPGGRAVGVRMYNLKTTNKEHCQPFGSLDAAWRKALPLLEQHRNEAVPRFYYSGDGGCPRKGTSEEAA